MYAMTDTHIIHYGWCIFISICEHVDVCVACNAQLHILVCIFFSHQVNGKNKNKNSKLQGQNIARAMEKKKKKWKIKKINRMTSCVYKNDFILQSMCSFFAIALSLSHSFRCSYSFCALIAVDICYLRTCKA